MTRALPSSPDAEQGLLCSFLLSPVEVGALCAERGVSNEAFHVPAHAGIYSLLSEMWSTGKPIDIVTLIQTLQDRNALESCGGASLVSQIFTFLPTAANAGYYLEILQEKATLRRIIKTCTEYASRAYETQDDVPGLATGFSVDAQEATASTSTRPVRTIRELAHDKVRRMEAGGAQAVIFPTGIRTLDRESPLTPGSMPLIAGMRKAGKSILAVSVAVQNLKWGHRVLYFTLEDPSEALVDRITANLSSVPVVLHRSEGITERNMDLLQAALTDLARMPLLIRDDVYDLPRLTATVRQEKARFPDLATVIVDYAQLVRAKTAKGATREQEVATVSRTLRLLGLELGVAMVVLSQLNSDGDTRESKALENDCTAMWKVTVIENEERLRMIEIPFQRNGGSQLKFKSVFLGHLCRFENYTGKEE